MKYVLLLLLAMPASFACPGIWYDTNATLQRAYNPDCRYYASVYSALETCFGAVASSIGSNTRFPGAHKVTQNQTTFNRLIVAVAETYSYPTFSSNGVHIYFSGQSDGSDVNTISHYKQTTSECPCSGGGGGGIIPKNNFKFADECIDTTCPVILDLDGDGFSLGGEENMVVFPMIPQAGTQVQNWVSPGSNDAFLAYDINGNNRIDNGYELFGNGTQLPSGFPAENGIEAMVQWDDPDMGGNGNGYLDHGDSIWSELSLWFDDNADGYTQDGELIPITQSSVNSIRLRARERNLYDIHGNWLRFHGRYQTSDSRAKFVDVYFIRHY